MRSSAESPRPVSLTCSMATCSTLTETSWHSRLQALQLSSTVLTSWSWCRNECRNAATWSRWQQRERDAFRRSSLGGAQNGNIQLIQPILYMLMLSMIWIWFWTGVEVHAYRGSTISCWNQGRNWHHVHVHPLFLMFCCQSLTQGYKLFPLQLHTINYTLETNSKYIIW